MTKTYAQLAREIVVLQASARKLLAVEAKGAIVKINEMIAKYSLAPGDLKFASNSAGVSPSASTKKAGKAKAKKNKRGAAARRAKFSDGQGNVWGGRGPRPAWLRNAIAAGRTLESFARGAASATVASGATSPAKKTPSRAVASKRGQTGAGSAKTKSNSLAAAKSSSSAAMAAPAVATQNPVIASRKKVVAKARKTITPPVKKLPEKKGGATKVPRASKATTKTTALKTSKAASKAAASGRKATAKKAIARTSMPARKKPGPPSAARKAAAVASSHSSSALEAGTVSATA